MIRLEICANGIKSLRNAMEGCAQCVELCEALEVGGLTPSFGTLAKAIDISFIPMRVLIRPRPGNYIYDEEEIDLMKTDIMEQIIELGFDKVLTSGGKPTAEEGIPMLAEMQLRYGDRIAIMPGGGINLGNVMDIVNQTGVVNVHASLGHWVPRFNEKLYPNQKDNTGASMVWTESNYDIIYEMEKLINP